MRAYSAAAAAVARATRGAVPCRAGAAGAALAAPRVAGAVRGPAPPQRSPLAGARRCVTGNASFAEGWLHGRRTFVVAPNNDTWCEELRAGADPYYFQLDREGRPMGPSVELDALPFDPNSGNWRHVRNGFAWAAAEDYFWVRVDGPDGPVFRHPNGQGELYSAPEPPPQPQPTPPAPPAPPPPPPPPPRPPPPQPPIGRAAAPAPAAAPPAAPPEPPAAAAQAPPPAPDPSAPGLPGGLTVDEARLLILWVKAKELLLEHSAGPVQKTHVRVLAEKLDADHGITVEDPRDQRQVHEATWSSKDGRNGIVGDLVGPDVTKVFPSLDWQDHLRESPEWHGTLKTARERHEAEKPPAPAPRAAGAAGAAAKPGRETGVPREVALLVKKALQLKRRQKYDEADGVTSEISARGWTLRDKRGKGTITQRASGREIDIESLWLDGAPKCDFIVRKEPGQRLGLVIMPGEWPIAYVEPGSPADLAGLRAGMRIVAVQGRSAKNDDELVPLLAQTGPATEVHFTVVYRAECVRWNPGSEGRAGFGFVNFVDELCEMDFYLHGAALTRKGGFDSQELSAGDHIWCAVERAPGSRDDDPRWRATHAVADHGQKSLAVGDRVQITGNLSFLKAAFLDHPVLQRHWDDEEGVHLPGRAGVLGQIKVWPPRMGDIPRAGKIVFEETDEDGESDFAFVPMRCIGLETRVDPADGRAYPLSSFLLTYGKEDGTKRWEAALPVSAQPAQPEEDDDDFSMTLGARRKRKQQASKGGAPPAAPAAPAPAAPAPAAPAPAAPAPAPAAPAPAAPAPAAPAPAAPTAPEDAQPAPPPTAPAASADAVQADSGTPPQPPPPPPDDVPAAPTADPDKPPPPPPPPPSSPPPAGDAPAAETEAEPKKSAPRKGRPKKDGLEKETLQPLKEQCRAEGLSVSGTKASLIARLRQHRQ